ncbi:MAG: efflux RND transporter periplasmic adaptor subunit [Betaproteobacteria bacterium]|nr:efflux RND transporter periplasmic adaptor subunit [Betaproteobacteria bacterium]
MNRRILLPLFLCAALAACGRAPGGDAAKGSAPKDAKGAPAAAAAATPIQVSPEDLHTVRSSALASGPTITGSVQPERRADLRAEISSIVMQVARENGDFVKRGDLLVRLDDSAIRESLASAEAGIRAATQAFDQAARQLERTTTLRNSGMVSAAALDDAETRRNNAQSDLEGARTRAAQARQQLTRTEVRAPFDGLVTDRKVSAGDTAQIGKELVKVIDPASMRLEGLVSADHVGLIKAGQVVRFRVNGYGDQEFEGRVRRVNPSANPTTRQVEVLVDFADRRQPKLAGLYAEGRIETDSADALTVPASALVRDTPSADKAEVWHVADGALKRTPVQLGERDTRSGDFAIKSGLKSGDKVLRYPSAALKDGQKVETAAAAKPAPVASTGAPAVK